MLSVLPQVAGERAPESTSGRTVSRYEGGSQFALASERPLDAAAQRIKGLKARFKGAVKRIKMVNLLSGGKGLATLARQAKVVEGVRAPTPRRSR